MFFGQIVFWTDNYHSVSKFCIEKRLEMFFWTVISFWFNHNIYFVQDLWYGIMVLLVTTVSILKGYFSLLNCVIVTVTD